MSRLKLAITAMLGALLGAALMFGSAEGAGSAVYARILAFTDGNVSLGAAPTGSQVLGLSSGTVRGVSAYLPGGTDVAVADGGTGAGTIAGVQVVFDLGSP